MIKIKAFGMVAEKIQTNEMELQYMPDTEVLLGFLHQQFPDLKHIKFSLAVNKKQAVGKTIIPLGAEVALLPPFSGG
ncbi:MoaD/ThiS family protein [Aquiflexum sp.]|uniref:MoaD/ThiS family protein n=1 Tax=Aquiflexum sp. TaxID=1872584 RepID=UPI003593295E